MPEVEKNQTDKFPPIGDIVHDIEMLKDNEVPEEGTRENEGTFAQPEFHCQVPNDSEHHHQDGEPGNNTYGVTNMDNPNLKRHPSNNKSMDSLLPVRSSKRRRKAKVVRSSVNDDLPQEEEEQNAGKNRQDNSGSGEGSNVPNSTLAACTEGGGHAGGRHSHNNNHSTTASKSVSALSADEIATSPQLDRNVKDKNNKHEEERKKREDGARSGGCNGDGKGEQGAGREKRGKSNTVTNAGSDESRDVQKLKNQRSITPAVPPPQSIPCAAAAPRQVLNNNSKSIPAEQSHVDFISAAKAAQQLSNLHQNFSTIQAQFVGQIQTIIKTAIGGGPSPPDLDVGAMLRACSKAHEIIQTVAYKPAAGLEVKLPVAAAAALPPLQPTPNPTSLLMPSLALPPSITTVSHALQQQPLSLAPPAAAFAAAAATGGIFPPLPPTQQFPYGYAPGNNASMMGGRGGGGGGTGTGLPLPLQHYQQQQQTQSQQAPAQQQQIHRNLQQQQPQQPHLLNHDITMSLVGGRGNNNNIRIRRGNAPTFTGFMPTPHEKPPPLFTGGGERTKHVKGGS